MADVFERSDGVKLTLPKVGITSAMNCSHTVSIDGNSMEVTLAIRYLLADRERILTLLADEKAKENG